MSARVADPFLSERNRMVEEQLAARGISDPRVREAMRQVPRDRFVPASKRALSYEDRPLAIGAGQTISQPYIVALMTEQLKLSAGVKVLEVGTGSGYQSAVLAQMGMRVCSIERIAELARSAARRLEELGIRSVRIRVGDGSLGWPEEAPFDGIVVTAYVSEVPAALRGQLADGGRMVIPVGRFMDQTLLCVERRGDQFVETGLCGCLFVPLIGTGGWSEEEMDPGDPDGE